MEPELDEKTAALSQMLNVEANRKTQEIVSACERRDLHELRSLAESKGGFLADSLRQRACKVLPTPHVQ